jgi:hypothetical protein
MIRKNGWAVGIHKSWWTPWSLLSTLSVGVDPLFAESTILRKQNGYSPATSPVASVWCYVGPTIVYVFHPFRSYIFTDRFSASSQK